jgi:hypothetical protein
MRRDNIFTIFCLTGVCNAFVGPSMTKTVVKNVPHNFMSSYEVDSDEDAEQRLGESSGKSASLKSGEVPTVVVNGNAMSGRYDDVLASVGLEGKIKHAGHLPEERVISSFGIFCNRELNLNAITAIGFDMVSMLY